MSGQSYQELQIMLSKYGLKPQSMKRCKQTPPLHLQNLSGVIKKLRDAPIRPTFRVRSGNQPSLKISGSRNRFLSETYGWKKTGFSSICFLFCEKIFFIYCERIGY